MERCQWDELARKKDDHIMDVVQESLHDVPANVIAGELNEFTPGLPRRSATIREAGVRFLSIPERRGQKLVPVKRDSHHSSAESYLVRHPDVWIHYTIYDHMPDALHVLSVAFGV